MNYYEYVVKIVIKLTFILVGIWATHHPVKGAELVVSALFIGLGVILWEGTVKFNINNQIFK